MVSGKLAYIPSHTLAPGTFYRIFLTIVSTTLIKAVFFHGICGIWLLLYDSTGELVKAVNFALKVGVDGNDITLLLR